MIDFVLCALVVGQGLARLFLMLRTAELDTAVWHACLNRGAE